MFKKNQSVALGVFFFISFIISCQNREKNISLRYIGTWEAEFELNKDTATIVRNGNTYIYTPVGEPSSIFILNRNGDLQNKSDSSFIIKYNDSQDQLILKNIFNQKEILAKRIE